MSKAIYFVANNYNNGNFIERLTNMKVSEYRAKSHSARTGFVSILFALIDLKDSWIDR